MANFSGRTVTTQPFSRGSRHSICRPSSHASIAFAWVTLKAPLRSCHERPTRPSNGNRGVKRGLMGLGILGQRPYDSIVHWMATISYPDKT